MATGSCFRRFTLAIDVIGHELTHGVTQYTSNLNYSDQPGALNESLSDVFGSLVKQRQRGQTASQADWLIGEGLFTANVKGVALRSLKEPGTAYDDPVLGRDPQPAHMRDYVHTSDDDGGIHINSGIPNHAFFLVAAAIGGYAWEKAGRIWYTAARDKFTSTTDFCSRRAFDLPERDRNCTETGVPSSAPFNTAGRAWASPSGSLPLRRSQSPPVARQRPQLSSVP